MAGPRWGVGRIVFCGEGVGENWPKEIKAATSMAEETPRSEDLAEVSTYITAFICWDMASACCELTGAWPALASVCRVCRSLRRSLWQPTSRMGVAGAWPLSSGTQWLMAPKSELGSLIL